MHPGSTLRGGFGYALRKMVCYRDRTECHRCPLSDDCVYGYLFNTSPPDDTEVLSTLTAVARPFVIEPPLKRKTTCALGDTFTFHLTLVGRAVDYISYVVVAFQELGRSGLGRSRGRFHLARVEAVHALKGTGETVFDIEQSDRIRSRALSVDVESVETRAKTLPTDHLGVAFLTPTRLKHHGELVWHGPPFHVLLRRLLDRVSSLSYFHCGERWDIDFRGWIEHAEEVQIADAATRWADWERYSGRQDQGVKMGGLVGPITYTGDLAPFRALLALGTLVHVGKGTVMGNGRFALKGLNSQLRS
jgi:CRISPR/Cas system endoribonuclease Cas6 (RAMP superfamily)